MSVNRATLTDDYMPHIIYSKFDQSTLDREYSPSSCIKDIGVYLDQYTRISRQVKNEAIKQGSCFLDLAYGPADDERLDLFAPFHNDPAPLHIFIHGGYWQALTKNDSLFAAAMFQHHGSFFAALNYSLAPHATMTQIVDQNRRAIAWLFEHADQFGFDRERIYLSGSSAGAHLTMMMLLSDWREFGLPNNVIKGACAVSGIYDLEPIRLSYVNEPLQMDAVEAYENSPSGKALLNSCPIILACGDNETNEFKRQTYEYRDFLTASGEAVVLKEIQNRNHFNIIMDFMHPTTWLSQQVLLQMKLSGG